jgi:hypothetical protein
VVFYSGLANGKIDWAALAAGVPSWAIMILIVCLDHMLMLAYTETALKIELDYNREMIVGGAASILNGLLTASPAYAQTKFTVLNYSFASRTDSAIPSLVTAAFGGALFFSGVPVIDFLPRFLLAGLLIYSGSGFLIENLWDARNLYDRFSFGSIWAVFIINVIAGELLPQYGLLIAFVVGMTLLVLFLLLGRLILGREGLLDCQSLVEQLLALSLRSLDFPGGSEELGLGVVVQRAGLVAALENEGASSAGSPAVPLSQAVVVARPLRVLKKVAGVPQDRGSLARRKPHCPLERGVLQDQPAVAQLQDPVPEGERGLAFDLLRFVCSRGLLSRPGDRLGGGKVGEALVLALHTEYPVQTVLQGSYPCGLVLWRSLVLLPCDSRGHERPLAVVALMPG